MPRRAKSGSIAKLVLLLLPISFESAAIDNACPTPTSRPDGSPSKQHRTLDPYSISHTVAHYYDAPLGLGFLELVQGGDQYYYDWMFELTLPVWHTPDAARSLGWLMQGQVHSDNSVVALTGAGMVETAYEQTNFIVWDTQGDWLKLKLTSDLSAWTHRCHLETVKLKLEPISWQSFFRRHKDWLHFRTPVPHILRSTAGVEGERVTTIGLNHKLALLDIRGDWMEVEVEQPDRTCGGPDDEDPAITHRGWVKWRDERGPWIYIYTRGC